MSIQSYIKLNSRDRYSFVEEHDPVRETREGILGLSYFYEIKPHCTMKHFGIVIICIENK